MILLFILFIALVSIIGTIYPCLKAIENDKPKWYDILGIFCSLFELIILGNLLVLWLIKKISELIRLYYTKTRIICKDQSTSAVSLSLDEIMENKNKALKGLMECEKEELIRYLLNDGMF